MAKAAPVAGALMAGLVLAVGAEAKTVSYDIDGQRYTYSTNNREQVAVARERIAAARAAADARARAEAERSANPLVRAFGSDAQRQAAAADARLRETLARTAPLEPSAVREPRRAPAAKVAVAEPKPAARPPKAAARPPTPDPVNTGSLSVREKPAARPPESAQAARPVPAAPKVEAIVFDFASGIKTIHMTDGSVDEDVFDRTMAASLKRAHASGGPRVSFINESAEAAAPVDGPDADRR
jgi:hypothetical protein